MAVPRDFHSFLVEQYEFLDRVEAVGTTNRATRCQRGKNKGAGGKGKIRKRVRGGMRKTTATLTGLW